jgi:predicted nucleotidyltransferase
MNEQNLDAIRFNISLFITGCKIILFGSRAKDTAGDTSDYDLLVITKENLTVKEERHLSSLIRKRLAGLDIDADVIIRSESEAIYFMNKPGSIVREALREGLPI